jgi:hypothetical protein
MFSGDRLAPIKTYSLASHGQRRPCRTGVTRHDLKEYSYRGAVRIPEGKHR